ncbi:hypothetical protein AM493_01200 [Flavobacterium akiainvivens]|uniref:Membrane protein insertion efficiency factor YidD n=1 Tax=Flavobacterium akiainvivens TaxID=1202724 RepID=A0A0M8MEW2_9FLAO|nr:membrane protein insertion efficiency factor YidD [Flavobacterium akiainvivens]KOS04811.1 hypothetical protein AM493_01200 [Flavobacterium akiainvivens]SFQ43815.1 hypothetical protein SAMN05444144_104287 [Flavobacterium akiainvivens]
MKHLLLIIIKLYWLIPVSKRRTCLFKKSCSHFVYDATAHKGLFAGLKALQYRYKTCRHGAYVYKNTITGNIEMVLPNNDIVAHNDIADNILAKLTQATT